MPALVQDALNKASVDKEMKDDTAGRQQEEAISQ